MADYSATSAPIVPQKPLKLADKGEQSSGTSNTMRTAVAYAGKEVASKSDDSHNMVPTSPATTARPNPGNNPFLSRASANLLRFTEYLGISSLTDQIGAIKLEHLGSQFNSNVEATVLNFHLKEVNTVSAHGGGNEFLKVCLSKIQEQAQKAGIPGVKIYRQGANFIVAYPQGTTPEQINRFLNGCNDYFKSIKTPEQLGFKYKSEDGKVLKFYGEKGMDVQMASFRSRGQASQIDMELLMDDFIGRTNLGEYSKKPITEFTEFDPSRARMLDIRGRVQNERSVRTPNQKTPEWQMLRERVMSDLGKKGIHYTSEMVDQAVLSKYVESSSRLYNAEAIEIMAVRQYSYQTGAYTTITRMDLDKSRAFFQTYGMAGNQMLDGFIQVRIPSVLREIEAEYPGRVTFARTGPRSEEFHMYSNLSPEEANEVIRKINQRLNIPLEMNFTVEELAKTEKGRQLLKSHGVNPETASPHTIVKVDIAKVSRVPQGASFEMVGMRFTAVSARVKQKLGETIKQAFRRTSNEADVMTETLKAMNEKAGYKKEMVHTLDKAKEMTTPRPAVPKPAKWNVSKSELNVLAEAVGLRGEDLVPAGEPSAKGGRITQRYRIGTGPAGTTYSSGDFITVVSEGDKLFLRSADGARVTGSRAMMARAVQAEKAAAKMKAGTIHYSKEKPLRLFKQKVDIDTWIETRRKAGRTEEQILDDVLEIFEKDKSGQFKYIVRDKVKSFFVKNGAKVGGAAAIAGSLLTLHMIETAPLEERGRIMAEVSTGIGLSFGAAWGGAKLGAKIGAKVPTPMGKAVGTIAGGMVFGIVFGVVGEQGMKAIIDRNEGMKSVLASPEVTAAVAALKVTDPIFYAEMLYDVKVEESKFDEIAQGIGKYGPNGWNNLQQREIDSLNRQINELSEKFKGTIDPKEQKKILEKIGELHGKIKVCESKKTNLTDADRDAFWGGQSRKGYELFIRTKGFSLGTSSYEELLKKYKPTSGVKG